MTASELYDLVSTWPREAWPVCFVYEPEYGWYHGYSYGLIKVSLSPHLSELLFEASGMRWLLKTDKEVSVWNLGGAGFNIESRRASASLEPSLLHALTAAIAAIGKGSE